MYINQFFLDT